MTDLDTAAHAGKIKPAPPVSGAATPPGSSTETPTTWQEIMERSYVQVTAAAGSQQAKAAAKAITDHVTWDRYLSLIQGRASFAPIKFNGQVTLTGSRDALLPAHPPARPLR